MPTALPPYRLTAFRTSLVTAPFTLARDWALDDLDFLFVENVGNLVCPASYDLGENMWFVIVSVTEGEDKPLKHPTIFNTADADDRAVGPDRRGDERIPGAARGRSAGRP
jgi:hypothetical protein